MLGRRAPGVQVVDEQGRHQHLGRGGLEHLDAEPPGARVRGREHPVLGDRPGAGGRGDVHRHHRAGVAGDRGTPPLQALGQRVVRPLLGHQAVTDARVGPGRVGRVEQPPAGQRPQRPAAELGRRGPGRVGAGRLGDRVGRDGEHVGGRGQERERDVAAFGVQAHGQRVDGAGDPDVGRAVGVHVVAEYQRPVDAGQPVGDGRDVVGQIETRPLRQVPAGIRAVLTRLGVSDRDEQGPAAAPRRLQHAIPDTRAGQVDPDHPRAPAQQHRQRADLGARTEHHDRRSRQGEPLGGRGDSPDRIRAGRLDDAGGDPRLQLAQQGATAQPLTAVRHRQLAIRRPAAGHLDRGQLMPGRRRDQGAEPGLRLAVPDHPHPPVQRRQPVPGDGHRGPPRGQPGLDRACGSARGSRPASWPPGWPSSAPAGSTRRSASATTAWPSAEVLLRPSAETGKVTPDCSPPFVGVPGVTRQS